MCGIAAIFAYDSSAPGLNEGELTAIRDHMIARGPDGCGNWSDPARRVGLGHRRLSIIDLSAAGAQPMLWPERQLAITFNGEIYNYRALRAELESRGHVFHSTGDTEVLLHLYAEHGDAMVVRLRGMFAFALWDGEKRGLFLARDPFGIKPLYLADDGRTLRAASQVKALLAGGKISTTPDPAGHTGFFLWGHVPEPCTLYREIRSLPAGSTLWLGADGARREKKFCSITEILRSAEAHPLRLDRGEGRGEVSKFGARAPGSMPPACGRSSSKISASNFQLLRNALRDSVAHHLIADVPVGVFLSSGLDSTTLAALAAEQGGTLRTVTLGFEEYRGTPDDETPLAEIVARQYGAQHQTVWVRRSDFQNETERLFAAMDQPSTDGVNTYFVSLAAQRAGLKVALSGIGGDELFGGYPGFREIPRSVAAFQLFSTSACQPFARGLRALSAPLIKRLTSPKYASLLEYGGTFGGAYLLRRGLFLPWELPELLDPEFVREGLTRLDTLAALNATASLGGANRKSEIENRKSPSGEVPDSPAAGRAAPSARARVAALEMGWYLRNQLLRDADWAGMAHSVEIRVPLVDVTLLRALAPLLAGENPPTKRDLALAPISDLPSAVLNRPKTGFTIPVRQWLLEEKQKGESRKQKAEMRGLRGWARLVHARFPGQDSTSQWDQNLKSGKAESRKGRSELASPASTSLSEFQNVRISAFQHVPKRILVFRIGQLGDTIVALPAIWAARKHFPAAKFTLLCDRHSRKAHVLAADLLRGTGIFEGFESYGVDATGAGVALRPLRMLRLLARLRRQRFDTLLYLAPSTRTPDQIARDRKFFAAAGIQRFIGMKGFVELPRKLAGLPLEATPSEADLLLARLATDGIPVPGPGQGNLNLNLGEAEEAEVTEWLAKVAADVRRRTIDESASNRLLTSSATPPGSVSAFQNRPWLGLGPGSKMPAKRWPEERFREVVAELVREFDVWPVIFGGPEDAAMGGRLLAAWGCGYNAAGELSLRGTAAALKRCALYLGNDTGTMHLAAAAGVQCVAIFSAREWPGMWFPYGVESRVLRSQIDCEGCGLVECVDRGNDCLTRLGAADVLAECKLRLARLSEKPEVKSTQLMVLN